MRIVLQKAAANLRIAMHWGLLAAAVLFLAPSGCGNRPGSEPTDRRVTVSVPPLIEIVRGLVAPDVQVESIVPPGRTVHGFEPTPSDVASMGRSSVVVLVGAGLEGGWGEAFRRTARIGDRVVVLADLLGLEEEGHAHEHHDHDHEHEHCHSHGPVDPHVWLDPALTRAWAQALWEALPEDLRADESRREALLARIEAVHERYKSTLEPHRGSVLVTHHNAFGRIADRYGLEIAEVVMPIETAEPTPAQIARVSQAVRERNVDAVLSEPQFDVRIVRRIARAAGAPVATVDPLGADWFAMMEANLDAIDRVLAGPRDRETEAAATSP